MPKFVFELTGKRYFYAASRDHSSQKLLFDAIAMSSCDIQIKGKGALKMGDATLYERNALDDKETMGTIFYVENPDDSDTFSVFAHLPQATFLLLLNTSPEQASVHLTLSTSLVALQAGESGLAYGLGQGDVVWDVEKEQKIIAESVTLAVIFRAMSNKTNPSGQ